MSVYRDEPCGFCEMSSRQHCARCQVRVCEKHAPAAGAPYCVMCAKELKDDLELVRFAFDVHEEPAASSPWPRLNRSALAGLIRLLDGVQLLWQERQTRRRFARRTLEDIAAWRRRAGVRVRST